MSSSLHCCNSHIFMLRAPSRRWLSLLVWSHLWSHSNTRIQRCMLGTENRLPCTPCYHSSAPQTSDVMFLLGRRGFRQNSAGCLATGYRKKIIKLHWCSLSPSLCIWELVAPNPAWIRIFPRMNSDVSKVRRGIEAAVTATRVTTNKHLAAAVCNKNINKYVDDEAANPLNICH